MINWSATPIQYLINLKYKFQLINLHVLTCVACVRDTMKIDIHIWIAHAQYDGHQQKLVW